MAVIGERDGLQRVLKVLNTSKVAEDRTRALEDLSKSFVKCSSSEELNIIETLTTCWQGNAGSALRDCKWRTQICRVGSLRLPAVQRGPQIFTQYVQLATKAITWCKQSLPESKSQGARQDALLKVLM